MTRERRPARERAGGAREARVHLEKAAQFARSAARALDEGDYNPAISSAVVCGINAADVITIASLGRRSDDSDHGAAQSLLARAGSIGRDAAPILARLLPLKNLAQYRAALASRDDAVAAVADSDALLELARRAAADLPG